MNPLPCIRYSIGVALWLIGAGAAGSAGAEPIITMSGKGLSQSQLEHVISTFREACRPLGGAEMWSDLTAVRVAVMPEYAEFRLERGWKLNVHLALVIPDHPTQIPEFDQSVGAIAGHTLHYDLGGGNKPGFLASKNVSKFLCGLPVGDSGEDMFQAVPELSFLDAAYQ